MSYVVRRQRARVGGAEPDLLVAAFPLRASPGAVCLQLQDEQGLRRGGVYLAPAEAGAPAIAPRFDELFADLAIKLRARPALKAPLEAWLSAARAAARACRPRLEPAALAALEAAALVAADLARAEGELPGALPLEALLVASLLILVSEEERYPRPRYQGCDLALSRLAEALGVEVRAGPEGHNAEATGGGPRP